MCYVYSCVCSIYSVWIICGINVLLDHGLIVQFIFIFSVVIDFHANNLFNGISFVLTRI